MNKLYKAIFLLIPLLLWSFSFIGIVNAQVPMPGSLTPVDTNYAPLTSLPGVFTQGVATNPVTVMKGIYGLAIGIGSVIAVVMIIFAGFKYMYEESMSGKSGAKEMIINAFVGLFLILSSYILLKTVNPELVEFDLNLPGGRGRLTALNGLTKQLETQQISVKVAAETQTARIKEISNLQSTVTETDQKIANLENEITILKETSGEQAKIDAAQAEIDKLTSTKEATEAEIALKSYQNSVIRLDTLLRVSAPTSYSNEIVNISTLAAAGKLDQARTASIASLSKLSSDTTKLTTLITGEIQNAKSLTLTGDSIAERNKFLVDAEKGLTYLSTSKSMLGSALTISQSTGSAESLSAQFGVVLTEYEKKAAQFEREGRSDLALYLRNDMQNTTTILKVNQLKSCSSLSAAVRNQLTLCKQ